MIQVPWDIPSFKARRIILRLWLLYFKANLCTIWCNTTLLDGLKYRKRISQWVRVRYRSLNSRVRGLNPDAGRIYYNWQSYSWFGISSKTQRPWAQQSKQKPFMLANLTNQRCCAFEILKKISICLVYI